MPNKTLDRAKKARFSEYVLRQEAWFRSANELVSAMTLLEPQIEDFWKFICTEAGVTDEKNNESGPEHSLINVHMMLAGFAIENLCKGYLVGRLSPKQRGDAKRGKLPETLRTHDIVKLVQSTEMSFTEFENDLFKRIGDTIWWRGRYPSPTSHKNIEPFAQFGNDVSRIKTILEKLRVHVGAKNSYRCQDPNALVQAPMER